MVHDEQIVKGRMKIAKKRRIWVERRVKHPDQMTDYFCKFYGTGEWRPYKRYATVKDAANAIEAFNYKARVSAWYARFELRVRIEGDELEKS